jgi:hypothetical protein
MVLPSEDDVALEWVMPIIEDEPKDCCCCWLSIWSLGGDIGSAFILTGAEEGEVGGGVLFDTAKWGIPLKWKSYVSEFRFLHSQLYVINLLCCKELMLWCEEFHDVIIFKSEVIEKSCAPNVE